MVNGVDGGGSGRGVFQGIILAFIWEHYGKFKW